MLSTAMAWLRCMWMSACTFDFQFLGHLHLFLTLVTIFHGCYHHLEVHRTWRLEFKHLIQSLTIAFSFSSFTINPHLPSHLVYWYSIFWKLDFSFSQLPPPPLECCSRKWLSWCYYRSILFHLSSWYFQKSSFVLSSCPPFPLAMCKMLYLLKPPSHHPFFHWKCWPCLLHLWNNCDSSVGILPIYFSETFALNFISPFLSFSSERGDFPFPAHANPLAFH